MVIMAEKALTDKAVFFKRLYDLLEPSDNEEESTSITKPSSPPISSNQQYPIVSKNPNASNLPPSIHRTLSAPVSTTANGGYVKASLPLVQRVELHRSNTTTPLSNEVCFVQDTPLAQQRILPPRQQPRRTISAPTPSNYASASIQRKENPSALGKRKRRESSIKLLAEDRQIFRKFTFFYIPNDDKAPLRKKRITKAREHGVMWTKTWCDAITHIIVDKNLTLKDVVSFLKIPAIPEQMVMVNENYPLDCMEGRIIFNPMQKIYKVIGDVDVKGNQKKEVLVESPQALDCSLQLKPVQPKPGKWDYIPPATTPSPSEGLSQKIFAQDKISQDSDISSMGVWLDSSTTNQILVDDGQVDPQSKDLEPSQVAKGQEFRPIKEDEFEIMIQEARNLVHLPLDEDDEQPCSIESVQIEGPSNNSDTDGSHKTANKGTFNQENFSCMTGGTGENIESNPNAMTIDILSEMGHYYDRTGDKWRCMSYRKAVTTLRRQTAKITSYEQAVRLPSVGQRLALKIQEIAQTNHLRRLDNAKAEPTDLILKNFMKIYGVGFSQASKWIQQGHSTFEDLLAHVELTDNQRLGIEHFNDLCTRIPREEVTALGNIVMYAAARIDPQVEVIIGGSYRRGASDSGDIDCLLTKPNTTESSQLLNFLEKLISQLTKTGFLVAALIVPTSTSGSKWHGCCVQPDSPKPVWRRIDFLLAPATELGAALLYFTGNDIFNRSMRLLASRKKMRLNQRGLYKDVLRGPNRTKITTGMLIEGADEKRIFQALGVPWRPPNERIC